MPRASRLPAEFVPLARAFNTMAAQLGQRERELVATNDRLTVIASIDMLSGLANRRGFQSRLDFEWMKAQQYDSELSLLMIDVDHFKLFNDTYGHPEGDVCLTRLGETLAAHRRRDHGLCRPLWRRGILPAAAEHRLGPRAARSAKWCARRCRIWRCRMSPPATRPSPSASASPAPRRTTPQRPGDLIEAADAALYAAKHRGRNAVVEHGFVRIADGAARSRWRAEVALTAF